LRRYVCNSLRASRARAADCDASLVLSRMAPAWPFGVAPPISADNKRTLPGELTRAVVVGVVGVVGAVGARRFYVRYLRRIVNEHWVTPNMLSEKRWVRGYVAQCVRFCSAANIHTECGDTQSARRGQLPFVPHA
jgi:hypothetical protein